MDDRCIFNNINVMSHFQMDILAGELVIRMLSRIHILIGANNNMIGLIYVLLYDTTEVHRHIRCLCVHKYDIIGL